MTHRKGERMFVFCFFVQVWNMHTHVYTLCRYHLQCVTTSIPNPLPHPKIHPWEQVRGKITMLNVCVNAFCVSYTPNTLPKWAPCNIKRCKMSLWASNIGVRPTKGTMGNKCTGHAISRQNSGLLFPGFQQSVKPLSPSHMHLQQNIHRAWFHYQRWWGTNYIES